jgi:hypothetical protein
MAGGAGFGWACVSSRAKNCSSGYRSQRNCVRTLDSLSVEHDFRNAPTPDGDLP